MSFGQKLLELRKEKDFSQAEVAKTIGVDKSQVSLWENDKIQPSIDSVIALSKLFAVSVDYLVFDNVPREGFEAINDFELYESFRKTETLPTEDREAVKRIVDGLVFKRKVNEIPEGKAPAKPGEAKSSAPLRKVAGKS